MKDPNQMVAFFKTLDVSNLVKISKKKKLKFNKLLNYCIDKSAVDIKEFYILPVGNQFVQYDSIPLTLFYWMNKKCCKYCKNII